VDATGRKEETMTETEQTYPKAYTLVIDGDNVSIYRLPCPPDEPGVLEPTVTPSGLAWIARTPHGDFLAENLRGGVAEALDLFRDRDRGPGDPAEVERQWQQMVHSGTAPNLPNAMPGETNDHVLDNT
jgi:hypothetical protein